MHTFLIICILVEAVAIVVLGLRQRQTSRWIDDVLDLEEGAGKFKERLDSIAESVSEISEQRKEDAKDVAARIVELNGMIEAMRRRTAGGARGGSFETIRDRASVASSEKPEMSRKDLLALAEGK